MKYFIGSILLFSWLALACRPVLAAPYTLRWTEPTEREDGTALPPEQIFSYGILIDDIYVTFVAVGQTSMVLDIDISGPHIITMKTLDSTYTLSAPSNGVGVPLTPPVAPGICVSE